MSWKEDGSGKVGVSGAEVECTGDCEKANAIWSQSAIGYWEFKVSGKPGTWVGVCSQSKFGPSYDMKGLFYGGPGNLSDGNSLVTGHWGPKFGEGDVIGMRVEHAGGRTLIAFSKNGEGLGAAFDIEGWSEGKDLCPAVSMNSVGQKVCVSAGSMPAMVTMQKSTAGKPGVEGDWSGKFDVSIAKEGSKYRVSAKAGNTMNCLVEEGGDGKLKPGPIMSTRMMPPPHLQQLENEVNVILGSLQEFKRDGDKLVIVHGCGQEVMKPATGPGPAKKENVNWLN
eukprot:TRINITY_DN6405_c0_g1_i2.p1 TRINITY_DN6405_c0_g1~~TRINITY_DN6405_c0_g1_i2.p1  ORF type:complete len:290 (-),score=83.98 TRINITY_DN6405_c0_g1_i2:121-963(-)